MEITDRLNGNGRKTHSFSLKSDIVKDFNSLCEKHGFAMSKRIEVLLLEDIMRDAGLSKNAPLGEVKSTKV